MKKLAILISSMALVANSFAFTLYHQHKVDRSPGLKTSHGNEPADFSGTWAGNCDEEDVQITIRQDDKHITLILPHQNEPEPFTFDLNKLLTFNSSSTNQSESSMKHAAIDGNWLSLVWHELTASDHLIGGGLMEMWIIKDGDTIVLQDLRDESATCVLNKSN